MAERGAASFDPSPLAAVHGVGRVDVLDRVDSTQAVLRRRLEGGLAGPGDVVVAAEQTAGRGRRGRTWHSPPDDGLYFSILLEPGGDAARLPRWSLAAAVAVAEVARERCGDRIGVDWPNDVVASRRKIAGVLLDVAGGGDAPSRLLLGVGINLRRPAAPRDPGIADLATSIEELGGGIMEPGPTAAAIVGRLFALGTHLERDDWAPVAVRWSRLARGASGARVRTSDGPGTTAGIDDLGALLVELDDGRTVRVHAAGSVIPLD